MPHCQLSDRDELIFKMLRNGDRFCEHPGSIVSAKPAGGWYHAICTRCQRRSKSGWLSWQRAEEMLAKETQADVARYNELKETNVAQSMKQGFKEGVKQALDLPFRYTGDYTGDWLLKTIDDQRKKLLTKKVTKWTGVITSEWGGKPAILELCDSFEEANGFLLKNPKPLAGPIPIEIEVPL